MAYTPISYLEYYHFRNEYGIANPSFIESNHLESILRLQGLVLTNAETGIVKTELAPYLNWIIAQRGGQRIYNPPFDPILESHREGGWIQSVLYTLGWTKAFKTAFRGELAETETHSETVSESYNDSKEGTSSNNSNAQQFKSFPVIPASDPSETNPIDNKVGANVGSDSGSTTDTTEGERDTQRDNTITRDLNTREDVSYIITLLQSTFEAIADKFIELTCQSGVYYFKSEDDSAW